MLVSYLLWLCLLLHGVGAANWVQSVQRIQSNMTGNLTATFQDSMQFGMAQIGLGDLNLDTVVDIAVGADHFEDSVDSYTGAVFIMFLQTDGNVLSHQRIGQNSGGLTGT